MKRIIVCNGHKEEVIVKVDGDKTKKARVAGGGGVGVNGPGGVGINCDGNLAIDYENTIISKDDSFVKVGRGVKLPFSTSTANILLTIHLKNKREVCKSWEVKKNSCFIINTNGDLQKAGKKDHWTDQDGKNHKPEQTESVKNINCTCGQTSDICAVTGEKCEICGYIGKEKEATSYCEDCDEPEKMCDSCAIQHMRQSATRGHFINKDILNFPNHNKPNDYLWATKAVEVKADSITLSWKKPKDINERGRYQICYKERKAERWTTHNAEIDELTTLIELKADTECVFQVRPVQMDGEGKYSQLNESGRTQKTLGSKLIHPTRLVKNGDSSPSRYKVPMFEVKSRKDADAKCSKFQIGNGGNEKTIMLVGATETDKTTLVDGFVNYILGVNWDDRFRFTAIDLEKEETDKHHNEAVAQKEWIKCYSIDPYKGSRLDYRLTIIDTPGLEDDEIVEQIRTLFLSTGINAVCFLVRTHDARLTATQTYTYNVIKSLFGRNIEENICVLVTSGHGEEPQVLASHTGSQLPFGRSFIFNNSALFAKNIDSDSCRLPPLFWDTRTKSFFDNLKALKIKSLQVL